MVQCANLREGTQRLEAARVDLASADRLAELARVVGHERGLSNG